MPWDAGSACRADEGETRCDGATESGESDALGGEDEYYYCLCGGDCGEGGGVSVRRGQPGGCLFDMWTIVKSKKEYFLWKKVA